MGFRVQGLGCKTLFKILSSGRGSNREAHGNCKDNCWLLVGVLGLGPLKLQRNIYCSYSPIGRYGTCWGHNCM